MLSPRRINWWSHMSLVSQNQNSLSLDSMYIIRKATNYEDAKHTFFPGSEATRNRLKIFSKILIETDSLFKLCWDALIIIVTIYLAFQIPFMLSFFSDMNKTIWHFVFCVFLADLLLTFNTTNYYEGNLINNRLELATIYWKTNFFLDLLSCFPFEYFFWGQLDYESSYPRILNGLEQWIRVLLLLKLLKLYKLPKVIYHIQIHYPQPIMHTLLKICYYLLIASLPAHWMCCLYNSLYAYDMQTEYIYWSSPLRENATRYLSFLERVVQTMTSVGYGDVPIKSIEERVVTIIFMTITSGLLGVFVGAIQLAINKSSENTIYFRKISQESTIFMKRHKIPKSLKMRVSHYIRHLKFSYNKNLIKEEDIIRILSIPLREQIFLYTRGYVLIKIIQFKELSTGCLKALGYKMQLNFYAPEDLIIRQGEFSSNVYFIFSGGVSVFHEQTETTFRALVKGNYFGEISFLQTQGRSASVMSKRFSEIFSLSRHNFDEVLKSMPRDNEKIQILLRNLQTYGISYLGIKCFLCNQLGHVSSKCSDFIWKLDMQQVMNYSKERRSVYGMDRFERKDLVCNYLHDFNKIRVHGEAKEEESSFKERRYLKKKVNQYKQSVQTINRENSRLFNMINELSYNEPANHTDESNESEKNFLTFSVSKIERRLSGLVTDNVSYFPSYK